MYVRVAEVTSPSHFNLKCLWLLLKISFCLET